MWSLTIVFVLFLIGCSNNDDDILQENIEGIVLGTSGCSGLHNIELDGGDVIFAMVPEEFTNKDTRIRFDMEEVKEEDLEFLLCNTLIVPPSVVYRLSNVTLIETEN